MPADLIAEIPIDFVVPKRAPNAFPVVHPDGRAVISDAKGLDTYKCAGFKLARDYCPPTTEPLGEVDSPPLANEGESSFPPEVSAVLAAYMSRRRTLFAMELEQEMLAHSPEIAKYTRASALASLDRKKVPPKPKELVEIETRLAEIKQTRAEGLRSAVAQLRDDADSLAAAYRPLVATMEAEGRAEAERLFELLEPQIARLVSLAGPGFLRRKVELLKLASDEDCILTRVRQVSGFINREEPTEVLGGIARAIQLLPEVPHAK